MSVFAAVVFQESGQSSAVSLASRSAVNLVLQWAAFTALMLVYTHGFGVGQRYMAFITIYNWCSVIATGCMMVPVLLHASGMIGAEFALVVVFFVFLLMLAYFWYVARQSLQTSGVIAAGIVAIDFFLNIAIERVFGLH